MTKNEYHCLFRKFHEFSFGPLRWRSLSIEGTLEHASKADQCLQSFSDRLQALVNQALLEGCSTHELNTILRQHTLGEHHVDA